MTYDEEVYDKLFYNFGLLCEIIKQNSSGNEMKVDLSKIENIINNKIPETLKKNAPEDFYELYIDFKSEYEKFRDFILYDKLIGKNIIALGGGFSSGKSSFLNALMGKSVLPADIDPSTSVPTYIVKGEKHEVEGINVFDSKVKMQPRDIKKIAHGFGELENDDEKVTQSVKLGHVLESIFFSNGLYGQIFTNEELSCEELFDENVVVDLSRTGSSETKSLIMGLLVMKLQEYRMSNARKGNEPLKHVTVLEEAHNILKRTSTEQTSEGSNLIGKSVEMLANSIAEMRTYGEGFIIADQAPGLMDKSVIRNTNTKIIFGLPDEEDRELVGRAANLNDEQIIELSRLKTFVASVYQNNWLEPVLCNIDTNFKDLPEYSYKNEVVRKNDKMKYLEYLLLPVHMIDKLDNEYVDELKKGVFSLPITSEAKISFLKYSSAKNKKDFDELKNIVVYSLFNSEKAFDIAKDKEADIDSWCECFKDALTPDIMGLEKINQQKIVAMLTREHARLNDSIDNINLFTRYVEKI